jgi:hypothetical protein
MRVFQAFRAPPEVVARTLVSTLADPRAYQVDRIPTESADQMVGRKFLSAGTRMEPHCHVVGKIDRETRTE